MSRRVVITGVGLLSPLGEGVDAHREGWLSGRSAVGPVTLVDPGPLPFFCAGEVSNFKARNYVENRKNLKVMTRPVRLGVAAAHLAMADAGLVEGPVDDIEPTRFGMFVGAPHAWGEATDLVPALEASTGVDGLDLVAFGRQGLPCIHPLWLLKGLSNNVLGFTSQRYGAMGPNSNISGSGAGGAQAVADGFRAIAEGRADRVLAGGYDSLVCLEALTGYGRMGLLTSSDRSPETVSRPFDEGRTGFVPGEGGAFFVLEEAQTAAARGGHVYGEIIGAGEGADAYDPAAPEPSGRGLVAAGRAALRSGGVAPAELSLLIAHASGSLVFDPVECRAIRTLLGDAVDRVPVTAPKGAMGHTVAASGAFGVAAAILLLGADEAAPTSNLDAPDRQCDVRHVRGHAIPLEATGGRTTALVHAVGLGGQAATVLLAKN